jgi:hypothetical protein
MNPEHPQPNVPQNTGKAARIYVLKPFIKKDGSSLMNAGPGRSGAPAPPASALIHLKKNNGIDSVSAEEKAESETRAAVSSMILGLPGNLRKKMFALQSRIEAMARMFGLNRGKRYYKFDASHLLPIISNPQALAVYVSKYVGKGFQHRRPADKGMRLVGCSRNVSGVCSEHFSWADGAGRVWRSKLGTLGELFGFTCQDDFAKALGSKWAYFIRPAIDALVLPFYPTMREARADGWRASASG